MGGIDDARQFDRAANALNLDLNDALEAANSYALKIFRCWAPLVFSIARALVDRRTLCSKEIIELFQAVNQEHDLLGIQEAALESPQWRAKGE